MKKETKETPASLMYTLFIFVIAVGLLLLIGYSIWYNSDKMKEDIRAITTTPFNWTFSDWFAVIGLLSAIVIVGILKLKRKI